MPGYVDIHAHPLPGIDDGPPTMADAVEMAHAAADAGTRVLVATPHLRADFPGVKVSEIAERCAQLAHEIQGAGLGPAIVPGAEVSLPWALEASEEELVQASYGQRGKDVLIETPSDVSTLEEMLYRIRIRGLRVTLAHPERSDAFKRDPSRLERLSAQGILLQLNAGALLASSSSRTRRLAEDLCRRGLAHVIASDGHRATDWRPVGSLAPGVAALTRLVGPERADWMARDAPAAILSGAALPDPPVPKAPSRSLWPRRRA